MFTGNEDSSRSDFMMSILSSEPVLIFGNEMIKKISPLDVIDLLTEHLHFNPKIKAGQFYCHEKHGQKTVMWTKNPFLADSISKIENIISLGLPIFNIKKNNISLYPQFINCLVDEYNSYIIEVKLLTEVSFGKPIQINKPDGFCFLSNKFGRKVAFGEILDEIFKPLVDLGWYLRTGS